jgi:hypothetical protein
MATTHPIQARCFGCGRILAADNRIGLCASCDAAGVKRPLPAMGIESALMPAAAGMVITGIDVPFSAVLGLVFKVWVAFLIVSLAVAVPLSLALIWLR